MDFYEKGNSLVIEVKNNILQSNIIGNMSNVYYSRKDFVLSLLSFFNALKIY